MELRPPFSSSRRLGALFAALIASCASPQHFEPRDGGAEGAGPVPLDERAVLEEALGRGEEVRVLVVEGEPPTDMPSDGVSSAPLVVRPRESVRDLVPEEDWIWEGEHLPLVAVRLHDLGTLEAIEALPGIARVEADRAHTHDAIPSLELIGQPAALARGADGTGRTVAVLDTGADYRRADLGACTAPGPDCGVIYAQDFAADDGVLDDPASMHGTNVASIVRLVAPSSRIVALDVFSGSTASSLTIASAIDWVIAQRAAYGIVAVNMSLGYGGFSSPCATDALAVAVGRLRDAGIVPVVASGNASYTSAISSPACAPAAVSVGAVDSSGTVASFSNSASFLTLLAPGVGISAGGIVMSGTSQATPHVAGSVASILTAYPGDDVSAVVARLVGTGVTTYDARNGRSFPRLSLDAATAGGATAPPPDIAPPTGTFALASAYARSLAIGYSISASDPSGIAGMCLSTGTTCTTFVAFAAAGTFTLPAGDGLKTVRLWLRDGRGNVTATPLSATTTLDTRVPSGGTLVASSGIGQVTLSLGAALDVGTGIERYRIVASSGSTAPASCATGTLVGEPTTLSFVHVAPIGTTLRYRACAVDRAGNVSTGVTATGSSVPELSPPSGSIVLDGGSAWARSTRVSVGVTANDASGVSHVCLSATTSCTSWVAYAPTLSFTVASGSGVRPVYAWFRDPWGNASAAPVSDSISLDTLAPPSPVPTVTRSDGAIGLSFGEVSDTTSGVAGYLAAIAEGTTAPACAGGASVGAASGGLRQHTFSGLVNGRAYTYRLCAVDVAGNVSTGAVGTAIPAPELVPPSGASLLLAGGVTWTRTAMVAVAVSASDASGVASMCFSTATTCTAWVPYATTTTFSIGTTQGTRTVYAWFRDVYGNATPAPIASDSIGLDSAPPANPTVVAVARSGAVELSFGPSTDAGSGVTGYWAAASTGTTAPACTTGTSYDAVELRTLRVTATTTVRWRVCAVDLAGNVSAGATGATTPLP